MAINPGQYDLLVSPAILQEALLDKETGLAMAAGVVTFYEDTQRQTLKNVYYQTNAAGSYQYLPIPNPNTLTADGCLADPGGNAILPFYFPWDETNDLIPQAYYVMVVNAQSIPQFTLQNFPFMGEGSPNPNTNQQDLLNYMPNPQFAAHTNAPNNLYPNGVSAATGITIAPGGSLGWYFTKSASNTDIDNLKFTYITAEPNGLTGNPRWAFNPSCTAVNTSSADKTLHVRFDNVNRFASLSQYYTLAFTGQNAASSGSVPINVVLYKYYGTGGSAATFPTIATFELTPGYQIFQVSFVFGENGSQTIGPDNDDYFEIRLVFPGNQTYNVQLTDFILTPGIVTLTGFPEHPDHEVFATGIAGSMPTPNPDGSDLYLPIIYTPTGFNFDSSSIGNIEATVGAIPTYGLPFDGSTYFTNNYNSTSGIPYSRLGGFLYNLTSSATGIPLWGTGSDFVTAYTSTADTSGNIYISSNQAGTATPVNTSDPGMTGFTIATQFAGAASAYGFNSFRISANGIQIKDTAGTGSTVAAPTAGTAGFTVSSLSLISGTYVTVDIAGIKTAALLANPSSSGKYFTFTMSEGLFYVWYQVTNETDPAPGGTGIKVKLVSTDAAIDVTYKTLIALQGGWLSRILCVAADTPIPPGSYFTFTADSIVYSVWYQVNNSPTIAPSTLPGTPVLVSILSTDTAAEVASKTLKAINQFAFGLPYAEGLFLRGTDPNGIYDPNTSIRGGIGNNVNYGAGTGTFESDTFASHDHFSQGTVGGGTNGGSTGVMLSANNTATTFTGFSETRPVNMAVNWFIRY